MIGLSHKTASVETRELFSLSPQQLEEFYERAMEAGVDEVVYVGTCNRVEVYVASRDIRTASDIIFRLLEDYSGLDRERFDEYTYEKFSHNAVSHILSVVSSLDSMVVGENEITGQVKESYRRAVECNTTGSVLNKLFHQAFSTAKKVKTDTEIAKNPLSIAYIATEKAREIFDDLSDKTALLIGAGEMGELILKYMHKFGIGKINIANRSMDKAEAIAAEIDGDVTIIPLEDIENCSSSVDIIVTSVTAPHHIITAKMAREIMHQREGKQLFIIDIAVPRNIDPVASDLHNLYLFNVDDLKAIADGNMKSRLQEIEQAREIIEEDIEEFYGWYRELEVTPTITRIRQQFDEIRRAELDRYRKKRLKHLSDEDMALVEDMTRQIMTKTLHNPIMNLKKYHEELQDEQDDHTRFHERQKFLEELFTK